MVRGYDYVKKRQKEISVSIFQIYPFMMWMPALLAVIFCVPAMSEKCQIDVEKLDNLIQLCVCKWSGNAPSDTGVGDDDSGSPNEWKAAVYLEKILNCTTGCNPCCLSFLSGLCESDTYQNTVSCSRDQTKVELHLHFSPEDITSTAARQVSLDTESKIVIRINVTIGNLQNNTWSLKFKFSTSKCKTVPNTAVLTSALTSTKTPVSGITRPATTATTTTTEGTLPSTARTMTTEGTLAPATAMTTMHLGPTLSPVTEYFTTHLPQTDPSDTQSPMNSKTEVYQSSTAKTGIPSPDVPNGERTTENNAMLGGAAQPVISSGEVKIIVAVVLAVLAVASVGLLAFFVIRRKQFTCSKMPGGDKTKDVGIKACHNQVYMLGIEDETDSEKHTRMTTESLTASSINDPDNAKVRWSQLSADQYSVIKETNNDESSSAFRPLTSVSCVSQARHTTTRSIPENPDNNPSEINDNRDNAQRTQEATRNGEYTKLAFGTKGQDGHDTTSEDDTQYTPPGPSRARPIFAESGSTGVYHDLKKDDSSRTPRQTEERGCHILGEPPTEKLNGPATGVYYMLEEDSTVLPPQQAEVDLYHILEEPPSEKRNVEAASLHRVLEDNFTPQEQGDGGGELYHILEEALTMEAQVGDTSVYHVLEEVVAGELSSPGTMQRHLKKSHNTCVPLNDESAAEYSSLDFDGKSSAQERSGEDTDKVYSHLNEGDEDTYNEVDREKRREVIDGDYSHI